MLAADGCAVLNDLGVGRFYVTTALDEGHGGKAACELR